MKLSITEKKMNLGQISDPKFHVFSLKKISMSKLSKALNISSATAQLAPDLIKALENLQNKTNRKSAVDQEGLKPH